MQFNTVDEAKEYVLAKTRKATSLEEINSAIRRYQENADNAYSDESRKLWLDTAVQDN